MAVRTIFAFTCDRCRLETDSNIMWSQISGVVIYLGEGKVRTIDQQQLCPKCTGSFEVWLKEFS